MTFPALSIGCTGSEREEDLMDEKTLEQRIARINALYHKSQKEGLTEEEKAEQA